MSEFSQQDGARVLWAPLYESVLQILGTSNSVLFAMGDTNHEAANRTTLTTVGAEQVTVTYNEALTSFDRPPITIGPAHLPLITFNATDEEADTPDAPFWTVDDNAGANGFTIGFWGSITNTGAIRTILGRWNLKTGDERREFNFYVDASDILTLELYDDNANQACDRASDSAISMGSIKFFTCVYNGAGGASACNGVTLYEDGATIASTATNNGSYVGIQGTASNTYVGHSLTTGEAATLFYNGTMVGGPMGLFFTTAQLTADEILRLYQLGRAAIGV